MLGQGYRMVSPVESSVDLQHHSLIATVGPNDWLKHNLTLTI